MMTAEEVLKMYGRGAAAVAAWRRGDLSLREAGYEALRQTTEREAREEAELFERRRSMNADELRASWVEEYMKPPFNWTEEQAGTFVDAHPDMTTPRQNETV